jgi:CubicO group peptidase (beta-lactamase class C family)
MNCKRQSVLSVALILVAAVTGRADDIDDAVNRWIQQQHVPAASIAVIKDGFLIKAQGYGLANIENGIPARPDTVYKIGSVSKQFIATGIMPSTWRSGRPRCLPTVFSRSQPKRRCGRESH